MHNPYHPCNTWKKTYSLVETYSTYREIYYIYIINIFWHSQNISYIYRYTINIYNKYIYTVYTYIYVHPPKTNMEPEYWWFGLMLLPLPTGGIFRFQLLLMVQKSQTTSWDVKIPL